MAGEAALDLGYELDHRYTRPSGRVYLSGVQALVRLPLLQKERDAAAGLRTAGFISGYRGSPLGTYDLALGQAREHLDAHDIRFQPGVNEELAATAVWGSQQASLFDTARVEGVFAIWYGKGPGVDRASDALKHGAYAGAAPRGGVVVLAGDDPAARSSSIAHQSEYALVHCGIPVLNPANVQELLDLGLHAFALSRFSGCWVALKCVTDTVDSAASVSVDPERVRPVLPRDLELPSDGLHIRWTNLPLAAERRLYEHRLRAVRAYVRVNRLDRTVLGAPGARFGIVTTGKAALDVRQALEEMGVGEARARELGIAVYQVAMPWPLEPESVRAFARGMDELLVVEEKRPLVEEQVARILYGEAERPRLHGKRDAAGAALVPEVGELAPGTVADVLRRWLGHHVPELAPRTHSVPAPPAPAHAVPMRLPAFCAGCPHNTSTVVPEDAIALGGIGCHGMAVWLPERRTLAVTQMGGEGANWIGAAPFVGTDHVFQNLGDGTYFHSGLLAIRAAVAAGVHITYKILANGAVAMTGGQPIEGEPMLDGAVTVPEIARQLAAEGVARIAVVSDDPTRYPRGALPAGVTVHPREEIDRVQRGLREAPGVSALVYDQACAAEARRLRKRGQLPEPERRVVIHEQVCEGCGDCNVQSNCIAVEPVETELGRKRRIDQSACNKDYSCLEGYCPSFVTVTGGRLRRAAGAADDVDEAALLARLPEPPRADTERPVNVLVAGIGGTGVVTVGALLGMAAHLEGRGVSVLDVTGLAQKNGPVTSHVRVADRPEDLHASRIAAGGADLLIAADPVVAAGAEVLAALHPERTAAVVNAHVAPTSDFARDPDLDLSAERIAAPIRAATRAEHSRFLPATEVARALFGDAIATNLFLVGVALQLGRLPVGRAALERAIELNGRAVEMNRRALAWGRLAVADPQALDRAARGLLRDAQRPRLRTLEEVVAHRSELLTAYQGRRLARRYRVLVERVAGREAAVAPGSTRLALAVARYYAKLLAYKDEYEVARLYTDGSFRRQLEGELEGDLRIELHLAPQIANRRDPDTGRARKWTFGPWIFPLLRGLARGRVLRGTPLDPFGWTRHRRLERQLVREYEATVEELLDGLTAERLDLAVEIASLPEHIRGFDLVKERHVEEAREKQRDLLEAFRLRAPGTSIESLG